MDGANVPVTGFRVRPDNLPASSSAVVRVLVFPRRMGAREVQRPPGEVRKDSNRPRDTRHRSPPLHFAATTRDTKDSCHWRRSPGERAFWRGRCPRAQLMTLRKSLIMVEGKVFPYMHRYTGDSGVMACRNARNALKLFYILENGNLLA